MINISKIKNDKNVKKNLPTQFNTKQNKFQQYIHQLKLCSKIFNHKEFKKKLDTKNILGNIHSLPCI